MAASTYIPTSRAQVFPFLQIRPALFFVVFLRIATLAGVICYLIVVFTCISSFILILSIFSCSCWLSVCLLLFFHPHQGLKISDRGIKSCSQHRLFIPGFLTWFLLVRTKLGSVSVDACFTKCFTMEQSGNAMKQGFLGHLCGVSVHQDRGSHWAPYLVPAVLRLHHSSLDSKEIHLKAFDTNEICCINVFFFLS